jgi:hypothetical protein
MSHWLREIVGWVLLGAGVAAFVMVFMFLSNRWIIEGFVFLWAGVFLFRGGLHLLKVAMAARAAREVRKEVVSQKANTKKVRPKPAAAPAGRPRPSVVPGPNGER